MEVYDIYRRNEALFDLDTVGKVNDTPAARDNGIVQDKKMVKNNNSVKNGIMVGSKIHQKITMCTDNADEVTNSSEVEGMMMLDSEITQDIIYKKCNAKYDSEDEHENESQNNERWYPFKYDIELLAAICLSIAGWLILIIEMLIVAVKGLVAAVSGTKSESEQESETRTLQNTTIGWKSKNRKIRKRKKARGRK